ncbi:hypothetical protein EDB19DRAFT_507001 [Suillus lakei]|nr:hypothetical protein EDB19DRAFT_507001 [Suillus lakei]
MHDRVLLLDSATEHGVLEGALGRLVDGRICLSIAHRLSTVKGADFPFAFMWTDQISASEDPKAPAGYDVDDDAPVVDIPQSETCSTAVEEHTAIDSPKVIPASLLPKANVPISFPVSDDPLRFA